MRPSHRFRLAYRPGMTLIAEDVLLLLLHDDKGRPVASHVPTVLGGALLVELALAGTVEVAERTGVWRSAKVRTTSAPPPADPLLARAHRTVADRQRSAQDLVGRLGKGAVDELAERLAGRGILRREQGRMLGLVPVTRWPTADPSREEEVRRELTAVLVQGAEPSQRTAAIVGLLAAAGQAHKVVDHQGLGAGAVKKRAKQVADGDWAAKAVKDAIAAANAAVNAGIVAATAGVAASGG